MGAAPPPQSMDPANFPGDYYNWAKDLLTGLGYDTSDNNITAIVCWCNAEGTQAVFNPMATTQDMPKSTNFNSVGVKNYDSWDDGIKATVTTLKNGRYAGILNAFKGNYDYWRTCTLIDSSPWGTHHSTEVAMTIKAAGGPGRIVWLNYSKRKVSDGGHSITSRIEGAVTAPYDYAKSTYDAVSGLADFFGNTHNYYRLGQILMGAALFIVGLYITVKASPAQSLVAT